MPYDFRNGEREKFLLNYKDVMSRIQSVTGARDEVLQPRHYAS
jgi:hypothetical protein